jgi:hypothetical protein
MTTKSNKYIVTFILIPLCLAGGLWSLRSLKQDHGAHGISEQIAAARESAERMPPGTLRADEFIRRLKAIDPGNAPQAVKEALRDYVTAMEESLQAMKRHQDITSFEKVCALKAKALTDAIHKNY